MSDRAVILVLKELEEDRVTLNERRIDVTVAEERLHAAKQAVAFLENKVKEFEDFLVSINYPTTFKEFNAAPENEEIEIRFFDLDRNVQPEEE